MRAAVVEDFARPPGCIEFAEPLVAEGQERLQVVAAGLHPLVKALASGLHYGSGDELPFVAGVDGVGRRADGSLVYFGGLRAPYGTMATHAVVARDRWLPLPGDADPLRVAGMMNPAISAWMALHERARVQPGETVMVLGATGAGGQLAVQVARQAGAGRIVAVGRNRQRLEALAVDARVVMEGSEMRWAAAMAEAAPEGIHVIVDYLWGAPAEAAIAAVSRRGLSHTAPRVRLVQVGDMAGKTIALPAAVLRSSGLELLGTGAGTVSMEQMGRAVPRILGHIVRGELQLDVRPWALQEVTAAWAHEQQGARIVITP